MKKILIYTIILGYNKYFQLDEYFFNKNMEDIACPRCKTTKYRNPSLKLMVNVCGHALCESCVDLLFLKGMGI